MNKYVFPGADASCALNWVIGQVSFIDRVHFVLNQVTAREQWLRSQEH